jgi:hypothetical protein
MQKTSIKVMLAHVYAIGLFAMTAYFGVAGPGDYAESETTLQKLCSVVVTAYGALGVAGLVGLVSKRAWAPSITLGWAILLVLAAVLAPTAWAPGETTWWGVALGAVLAAALGWTVYLIVKRLVRLERE